MEIERVAATDGVSELILLIHHSAFPTMK